MRFAIYHPIVTTLAYGLFWAVLCASPLLSEMPWRLPPVLNGILLTAFVGYHLLMASLFDSSRWWAVVMVWIGLLILAGGGLAPLVMVWVLQALLVVAHHAESMRASRLPASLLVEIGLWALLVAAGLLLPVHGPLSWGLYLWAVFVIQALRIALLFNLADRGARGSAADRARRLMSERWHMF